jgi:transcription antitermination factor NusG
MAFWCVAQTEPSREHIAAKFLKAAEFEVYFPRIVGRTRFLPLFPTYLFVAIADRWHEARWCAGVTRLLMADGQPARLPDAVVAAIQAREDVDGLIRLARPPDLQAGDAVRIVKGSFEGHLGIYQGASGPERARLLVALLGRQVPVRLARSAIEPV